jgi:hypothetical protein
VADHVESRYDCVAVGAVGLACVGKLEHTVEFLGGQRYRRRIQPDVAVAVAIAAGIFIIGVFNDAQTGVPDPVAPSP